jgi:sugar/nucleoside kinase (ribokinase family)
VICFEGERTILVHHLPQYKFLHLPSNLKTKWLYLAPLGQGYNEIYQRAITLAAEKNIKIMLNPGITQIKQGLEHLKNIFRVTEVLIVNQHEAEELVHLPGFPVVDDLIKEISQTGPKVVVITGGKKGAWAYQGEKVYFKKTSHFSSLDATGAGDAFSTGFLAAYLRGEDLSTCLDWGTIDAESVILDYGAQKGLLTSEGLAKKIKSYGQTPRYFLKTKFR